MTTPPPDPSAATRSWAVSNAPGTLAEVRATVRDVLGAWGWTEDRVDDVVQIVSELVGNVIRHAYGQAELTLTRTCDGVEIGVGDRARDLLVLQRPANGDGGYGLRLLDLLTTRWTVEQHATGKHVRAHIMR
ncbi:ATP-binding protein [Embleya sp. NPDC050154]|uniref:ATP-binding protein n=1 Tax=unclassified Embleya TaxID=2699296 RepID=UPI00378C5C40